METEKNICQKTVKTAKGYLITAESTLNWFPCSLQLLRSLLNNFSTCQFPLIRFSICAEIRNFFFFLVVLPFISCCAPANNGTYKKGRGKSFSPFPLQTKCGKRQQQKHQIKILSFWSAFTQSETRNKTKSRWVKRRKN